MLLAYLVIGAISATLWPASHRRRWTIVLKALTWPAWAVIFGMGWFIDFVTDEMEK